MFRRHTMSSAEREAVNPPPTCGGVGKGVIAAWGRSYKDAVCRRSGIRFLHWLVAPLNRTAELETTTFGVRHHSPRYLSHREYVAWAT